MMTSIIGESFVSLKDCVEGFHNWKDLWNEDKRKCLPFVALTCRLMLEDDCQLQMLQFEAGVSCFQSPMKRVWWEKEDRRDRFLFFQRYCCWKKGRGCPQTHYATKTEARDPGIRRSDSGRLRLRYDEKWSLDLYDRTCRFKMLQDASLDGWSHPPCFFFCRSRFPNYSASS